MRPRSATRPTKFCTRRPAPLFSATGTAIPRRSGGMIQGGERTSLTSGCVVPACRNASSSLPTAAAEPASRAARISGLAYGFAVISRSLTGDLVHVCDGVLDDAAVVIVAQALLDELLGRGDREIAHLSAQVLPCAADIMLELGLRAFHQTGGF